MIVLSDSWSVIRQFEPAEATLVACGHSAEGRDNDHVFLEDETHRDIIAEVNGIGVIDFVVAYGRAKSPNVIADFSFNGRKGLPVCSGQSWRSSKTRSRMS